MPNLNTDRLQISVPPELKAKLHHLALLARPTTNMGALAAFLLETAVDRYVGKLDELDQQRLDLRINEWRDKHGEDIE